MRHLSNNRLHPISANGRGPLHMEDLFANTAPSLTEAIAQMIESRLGPAFDADDVVAALGADAERVCTSGPLVHSVSAELALETAFARLASSIHGRLDLLGLVVCVGSGSRTAVSKAVRMVCERMLATAGVEVSVVCGGLVDPALGSDIAVELWARAK